MENYTNIVLMLLVGLMYITYFCYLQFLLIVIQNLNNRMTYYIVVEVDQSFIVRKHPFFNNPYTTVCRLPLVSELKNTLLSVGLR